MRAGSILLPVGGRTRTDSWATPAALYRGLDEEFHFDFDPCPLCVDGIEGLPLSGRDVLSESWAGRRAFVNPPYREIGRWLAKRREPAVAVYLVPARTDTAWWHDMAMDADEIRFLRGRLRFGSAKHNAPFPSVVLVYRNRRFQ